MPVKQIDKEGHDTLDALAGADKFNKWMFETILPYIKEKILEIGSGIGNISQFLLKTGSSVHLSDFNESYCNILRNKFSGEKNLVDVISIDLVDEKFDEKFSFLFESFDTLIALNVVEHIEDDGLAIKNCKKFLKKEGHLIILVPAWQTLYNRFDRELGHYRRYTKKRLKQLIGSHLQVIHSQYFNFFGMFGWFFSGAVLKKKIIPSSQLKLYNKLVPVFRITDKFVLNKIGLSVIVVGKK